MQLSLKKLQQTLWCEKYRPKKLEQLVLPDDYRAFFEERIKLQDIPHLLFVGPVGSGKTTLARILMDSISCVTLVLNASDERGIQTVRDKIKPFVMGQFGDLRVVLLDEADATTPDFQMSLRNLMETYSKRARFILTANYENKIIDALKSRTQTFQFGSLDKKSVVRMVLNILKSEEIKFDSDDVLSLVEDLYPDVRKVVNTSQASVIAGKLVYRRKAETFGVLMTSLKKKDLKQIREEASTRGFDYIECYRWLFNNIPKEFPNDSRLATMMITVAEYMYRESFVIDKEINFAACMLQLMKVLGGK